MMRRFAAAAVAKRLAWLRVLGEQGVTAGPRRRASLSPRRDPRTRPAFVKIRHGL